MIYRAFVLTPIQSTVGIRHDLPTAIADLIGATALLPRQKYLD